VDEDEEIHTEREYFEAEAVWNENNMLIQQKKRLSSAMGQASTYKSSGNNLGERKLSNAEAEPEEENELRCQATEEELMENDELMIQSSKELYENKVPEFQNEAKEIDV
jgi:hypothetical protein